MQCKRQSAFFVHREETKLNVCFLMYERQCIAVDELQEQETPLTPAKQPVIIASTPVKNIYDDECVEEVSNALVPNQAINYQYKLLTCAFFNFFKELNQKIDELIGNVFDEIIHQEENDDLILSAGSKAKRQYKRNGPWKIPPPPDFSKVCTSLRALQ